MLLTTVLGAALPATQPAPTAGAQATLVAPQAITVTLDGRRWACEATGACVGRGGGTTQPLMRECRRFVGRLGAVSAYAREGLALTEAEIAQCNTAVRP